VISDEVEDAAQVSVELLAGLSSTVLSDALDQLGVDGAMVGIAALGGGAVRIVGPAQTVLQEARPADLAMSVSTAKHQLFVDHEVRPGAVIVVSTPDTPGASSWGYLLSLRSMQLGAVGTVIDGSARDPAAIVESGYPVFADRQRQVSAGSKLRLRTVGVDIPITCGNVRVEPGDIVLADDSGVVVCPRGLLERAAAIARELTEAEDELERRIRSGGLLTGDGLGNGPG
jgi:regulator of RNase E activity RraA